MDWPFLGLPFGFRVSPLSIVVELRGIGLLIACFYNRNIPLSGLCIHRRTWSWQLVKQNHLGLFG